MPSLIDSLIIAHPSSTAAPTGSGWRLAPMRIIVGGLTLCAASFAHGNTGRQEDPNCPLHVSYDVEVPYDYRTDRRWLSMVEKHHFPPETESLRKTAQGKGTLGSNISYTLNVYPNHHRALVSLTKLGIREKTDRPKGAGCSIDEYFRRATYFAQDDYFVRLLYAQYLVGQNRNEEAIGQANYVAVVLKDDMALHYLLGLVYLDLKEFEKAVLHAKRAAELGHQGTELKAKLVEAGKWPEAGLAGTSPTAEDKKAAAATPP